MSYISALLSFDGLAVLLTIAYLVRLYVNNYQFPTYGMKQAIFRKSLLNQRVARRA